MADSNTQTLVSPAKKEQKKVAPSAVIGGMGFFESGFETNSNPAPIELSLDHQPIGSIAGFSQPRSQEQETQSYGEFKIRINSKPLESMVDTVATSAAAVGGTIKEVTGDVSDLFVNSILGVTKKEAPVDPEKRQEFIRVQNWNGDVAEGQARVQASKQAEVNNMADRLGLPVTQVAQEADKDISEVNIHDVSHSSNRQIVEQRNAALANNSLNSVGGNSSEDLSLSLNAHEGNSKITGPIVGS
jgi:hypothetical protein